MRSHGPLARYVRLRWACAPGTPETFSPPRLQRTPLVSDPDMHHGTYVTHMPWCMSGSLNRDGGENVHGFPGACATRNFTYLARGPWWELTLFTEVVGRYIHVQNREGSLCEVQVKGKGKDPTHLIACDHVSHHYAMTCVAQLIDTRTPSLTRNAFCRLDWHCHVITLQYHHYIENNVCTRVKNCLSAHERFIFVFDKK